ncbi:MAG: glycoside hydrolase family 9 protein [Lapillicoccus sp.]
MTLRPAAVVGNGWPSPSRAESSFRRRGRRTNRAWAARLTATAAVAAATVALAAYPSAADPPVPSGTNGVASSLARIEGVLRLNQQGYLPGEAKQARLMVTRPLTTIDSPTTYTVTTDAGDTVLTRTLSLRSLGQWSNRYRAVYPLDLTDVRRPGRYRVTTSGGTSTSAAFQVSDVSTIYGVMLTNGIAFDQSQRDGHDVVPGALNRRPSHLTDASATLYQWPTMQAGSDLITDPDLSPVGGPVNVEGGWFDAGDYLKFTHSTAYADIVLYSSARLLGSRAPSSLVAEARHGEQWLEKMWNPTTGILYLQVGIGSGNESGTFTGDHDHWRLPEVDDHDRATADRYVAHRPVFAANQPGTPISPNLVGRVSAAFALAAQSDATGHPERARHELALATSLYAKAATNHPPQPLVTALPHAFYPEDTWRDDMQLGAAEIALASQQLHQPAGTYLRDSAGFAQGFIAERSTDTLNLYDTAALADVALSEAIVRSPGLHLAVDRSDLVADLGHQLERGVAHSRADPFGAPAATDEFDVNSHSFGLIATAGFYDALTGTDRFASFASTVRSWLLGGDPWGVTAMVGVGDRFPQCMQHQVANLTGSADGTPPVDVGAVVNGPNGAGNFDGGLGGFQQGMARCTSSGDQLSRFDTATSRYVDDVRSWQTNEPALDMTGAAILAAAAQLHLHPTAAVR